MKVSDILPPGCCCTSTLSELFDCDNPPPSIPVPCIAVNVAWNCAEGSLGLYSENQVAGIEGAFDALNTGGLSGLNAEKYAYHDPPDVIIPETYHNPLIHCIFPDDFLDLALGPGASSAADGDLSLSVWVQWYYNCEFNRFVFELWASLQWDDGSGSIPLPNVHIKMATFTSTDYRWPEHGIVSLTPLEIHWPGADPFTPITSASIELGSCPCEAIDCLPNCVIQSCSGVQLRKPLYLTVTGWPAGGSPVPENLTVDADGFRTSFGDINPSVDFPDPTPQLQIEYYCDGATLKRLITVLDTDAAGYTVGPTTVSNACTDDYWRDEFTLAFLDFSATFEVESHAGDSFS